jgi:hypothetical protein
MKSPLYYVPMHGLHLAGIVRDGILERVLLFQQPCGEQNEPLIGKTIGRDKFVHQPIVRRPAHSLRLIRVSVIGRMGRLA